MMTERFICPHCCTPLVNPFIDENAKLRELVADMRNILSFAVFSSVKLDEMAYELIERAELLGIEV